MTADVILVNGRIATLDRSRPTADAVAIEHGKFIAVGNEDEIRRYGKPRTRVIDLKRRRVVDVDAHA